MNSRREALAGNRSNDVNSTTGTYLFGSGGNKWSNLQIAYYLLGTFQPWLRIGTVAGAVNYVPLFRLVGQTSGLDSIYEHHNFHGLTVREALNRLISRKRGFGWRIATDGVGPIYIVVFSLSQYPIVGSNAYVPANTQQVDVFLDNDRWIQCTLRISNLSQVDEIVVQSNTPVKTMATLSFLLGSLEAAWDPTLDTDLPTDDENFPTLAATIYNDWSSIDTDNNGFISFVELLNYSIDNSSSFAFIGEAGINTARIAFSTLDSDQDGWISVEDLEYWIPSDTSYQAATEEERATDKYAAVFSQFQVPKNFDWTGWAPYINDLGQIDLATAAGYWNHDNALLRYLPILEPGFSDDAEREYLEPFAVIQKKNRSREILLALANAGGAPYSFATAQAVVTDLTQPEFDEHKNGANLIDWPELLSGLAENPEKYIQLDRAQQVEITEGGDKYPACTLQMGDSGLRIAIKSEANHIFGRNHFDPALSETAPLFDYETLLATVFIETDVMPRVRIPIYASTYQTLDQNGIPITVQIRTPQGRQAYIEVPGKEVWIAAPYTVTGLDGESLKYFRNGEGGVIRNDIPDLQFIALVAYIWHGQERASAEFDIQNQLRFFLPGDLVRATISGWWFEQVGTCVTSIHRHYQEGTHTVSTGYAELDPQTMGGGAQ